MSSDFMYVHLDTVSNSLFARGLSVEDFSSSLSEVPEHILLLDANETAGAVFQEDCSRGLFVVTAGQMITAEYNGHRASLVHQSRSLFGQSSLPYRCIRLSGGCSAFAHPPDVSSNCAFKVCLDNLLMI